MKRIVSKSCFVQDGLESVGQSALNSAITVATVGGIINILKNEIHRVHNNIRYRILNIKGNHYIIDMERPIWAFIFPVIYWFMPHAVYRVDDKPVLDKIKSVKVEQPKKNISSVGIGGISLVLVNLTKPLLDYLNVDAGKTIIIAILLFIVFLLIFIRAYISKNSESNIRKNLNFEKLPQEKLYIWPTSIKHILLTLFYYLLFLSGSLATGYIFIIEKNTLFIFIFTVMFTLFLIANVFVVSMDSFKVKFID